MKKFQFPLGRALDWREMLARIEETKLERLYAELRAIDLQRTELQAERARSERAVAKAESSTGFELATLDAFRRFAVAEHTRLQQRRTGCLQRISEQIQTLVGKRRDVRLLEHLKGKRLKMWHAAIDTEIESQAAELHLIRRGRN